MTTRNYRDLMASNYYSNLERPVLPDETDSPESGVDSADDLSTLSASEAQHRFCPYRYQHCNKDGKSPLADHVYLFHRDCLKCRTHIRRRNERLCTKCQHLRLGHVLHCLKGDKTAASSTLCLGTVADFALDQTDCRFCRFIRAVIIKYAARDFAKDRTKLYGTNKCMLKVGRGDRIFRPGGLVAALEFRNRTGSTKKPESVTLFFRCLDGSDLTPKERFEGRLYNFFNYPVEVSSEYSLRSRDKGQTGKGTTNHLLPRADIVKPRCDWALIESWLEDCTSLHKHGIPTHHDQTRESLMPSLLVDIHQRCVVEARVGQTYAALSYVWGPDQNFLKCVSSNKAILMGKGSLLRLHPPRTIADALTVCQKLRISYLWVDSLCIVQNDDEFKDIEISRMADIYTGATLTIVAVDGESAHSGLCGVSRKKREAQVSIAIDGLEAFDFLPKYGDCVLQSPWAQRAWTYQESCLSRRLLLFAHYQVFFRCDKYIYYEDPSVGSYGMHEWARWMVPTDIAFGTGNHGEYDTFVYFAQALKEYSSRKLTFESDILNAFVGIIRVLYSRTGGRSAFGMPEADFHKALLWSSYGQDQARDVASNIVLPSWSWAWTRGKISLSDHADVFAGSDIQYFVCQHAERGLAHIHQDIDGDTAAWGRGPVDPLVLNPDWPEDISRQTYISIGRHQLASSPLWRMRIEQDMSTNVRSAAEIDLETKETMLTNFTADEVNLARRMPGSLIFRAPIAHCYLRDHSTLNDDDQFNFSYQREASPGDTLTIFNVHHRMAGFIHMNREWIAQHVGGGDQEQDPEDDDLASYRSEHPESAAKADVPQRMFTFIALSVARAPTLDGYEKYVEYQVAHNIISNRELPALKEMIDWWDQPAPFEKIGEEMVLGYSGDRIKDVRYYDADGKFIKRTPLVNVMLVERLEREAHDSPPITPSNVSVFRRVGIGEMYLARWADAEPEVETIILR